MCCHNLVSVLRDTLSFNLVIKLSVKIIYFIFFSSRTLFLFLSFIYFFAKHYGIAQV